MNHRTKERLMWSIKTVLVILAMAFIVYIAFIR